MPKQRLTPNDEENLCRGGASYGCGNVTEYSRDADGKIIHDRGDERVLHPHREINPLICRHCGSYMGCRLCADIPKDLVCLKCHDWATKIAVHTHGEMVKDKAKIAEAWRLVQIRANAPTPYGLCLQQHESPQASQAYHQAAKQADDDIDRLFRCLWSLHA